MPHIRPQETVDLSFQLTDRGLTDRENAAICGVAIKTIRRWRRLYRRRGIPRGQISSSARCPRCQDGQLDEAAYAHLLGWYLGDGHIVHHQGRGIYWLAIHNDRKYPGLNAEITETLKKVKPGAGPSIRERPGCLETKAYWKHWPCLFPQHGPGMKHTRPIVLEPWQREIVERHAGLFLRGLFHSDGCRGVNWTQKLVAGQLTRYEYPRYLFSNTSVDILGICTWALDLLGIAWRRANEKNISVARKEAVARLDEYVGPKY